LLDGFQIIIYSVIKYGKNFHSA